MKTLVLLFVIVLVLGCTSSQSKDAEEKCVLLCKQTALNLTNGPCLSNNIVDDWACDVAHSPRQAVDNLPENQCIGFRNGSAHHFVEVDENCTVIKLS